MKLIAKVFKDGELWPRPNAAYDSQKNNYQENQVMLHIKVNKIRVSKSCSKREQLHKTSFINSTCWILWQKWDNTWFT